MATASWSPKSAPNAPAVARSPTSQSCSVAFGGACQSEPSSDSSSRTKNVHRRLNTFSCDVRASASKCLLSGSPSAPHRRPPSSAVSALVLSLTAPLLCAYLRVSAPPRQNHTLRFPSPFHHNPVRGMELCASPPETRPLLTEGHHPPLSPRSSSL